MSMIGRFMPYTYRFWYLAVEDLSDYRYEATCNSADRELQAEIAAEDYHGNHDGWEARWPRTFVLFDSPDGPEVARFTVEREYDPQFYATELPPAADAVDPHAAK